MTLHNSEHPIKPTIVVFLMELSLKEARGAFLNLSRTSTEHRNELLRSMKRALESHRTEIELANAEDLTESKKLASEGKISQTLVERLGLQGKKFDTLMNMVDSVANLPDPLGKVAYSHDMLSDGSLSVHRVSCPIGVIAVIFESRPEAAVQIASLCVKSGNAVILKGGKEALHTVRALTNAMRRVPGLEKVIHIAESREDIKTLLQMDKLVDLVIPRGGAELVKYCKANTTIPVLGHADGICAVYIDSEASLDMATKIIVDAKTQYPAVCNAAETLLVHSSLSAHLDSIIQPLIARGVTIRACERTYPFIQSVSSQVLQANPEDFDTEYCDLILALRIVDSVQDAINHINIHGSHHTDAIVTNNAKTAELFMESVDSADVMWNASTRFADGNRFGFGAEVGVSTNKIHARGPVGLEGLTSYKYRVYGNGNTVGEDGPKLTPFATDRDNSKTVECLRIKYHR